MAFHAFGDFDGDGFRECVFAGGKRYWVYESPANNTYEQIVADTLVTSNIFDCFAVPDANRNGKMEFVIKGFYIQEAVIHAFILEADSNNSYSVIQSFNLPGGDYYGGHSDAGDVDGDSIPEIALEARQNVFIIKGVSNDSFVIWDTLPGSVVGSSIRIFDIDDNGLAEVLISGRWETRIYEYEPSALTEIRYGLQKQSVGLKIYPNPFSDCANIRITGSPEKQNIGLKIYNAVGVLVKDYPKLRMNRWPYIQLTWSGTDHHDNAMPAGVYFIEATVDEEKYTTKIVKLK